MDSLLLVSSALICFLLAYFFYGRFLQNRLFPSQQGHLTPAHVFKDEVDYVPTERGVLLAHHFTSMAGITPLMGPVIAIIWGYLPALLWVVLGSIFLGMTHDLGSLMVSLHNQGRSIGDAADSIMGRRAKILFLLFIFLLLWLLITICILVIASLFDSYPEVVLPVWFQIIVALFLGYYLYRKRVRLFLPTLISLFLFLCTIYLGLFIPITMPSIWGSTTISWSMLLLLYAYLASILPVWSLLQPRDYLNFWQILLVLALALGGILMHRPPVIAPAVNVSPQGAPLLFPFLFVTMAGGAISGIHSLVSSGMTGKELKREEDARPIACGSMLLEGSLAVMAILACSVGSFSLPDPHILYSTGKTLAPLEATMDVFVAGLAVFIQSWGIPGEFAVAFGAILVISLAMTTLDSAVRIKRYIIQELADTYDVQPLTGRHPATLLVVSSVFMLLLLEGGLLLWPLFGITNQLLAAMAFLMITFYLAKNKKPLRYTLLPMIFLFSMTGWALLLSIGFFMGEGEVILTVLGGLLFILEIWFILEAIAIFRRLSVEEMIPLRL